MDEICTYTLKFFFEHFERGRERESRGERGKKSRLAILDTRIS